MRFFENVDEFEEYLDSMMENGEELPSDVVKVRFNPEGAGKFYDKHFKKNRDMTPSAITKLTNMMNLGEFAENIGSTIIIGKKAELLDAHHRVSALRDVDNKNYTYDFWVIMGATPSPYMDTGKHRSSKDNLSMLEHTTQEDIELLRGPAGKVVSVYTMFAGAASGVPGTYLMGKYLDSAREVFVMFNDMFSEAGVPKGDSPNNGCIAAIFDAFMKGKVTNHDIISIFYLLSLYIRFYKLQKKNAHPEKYISIWKDAQNFEEEYFDTRKIWYSLVRETKKLNGGNSATKSSFYLATMAIDNWLSGKDAEVTLSDSHAFNNSCGTCCANRFNIEEFKNNYELVYEKEEETEICTVSKTAA